MKIFVLLREVQDGISQKNSRNEEEKIKLNPYDLHALEEAIRQKEQHDGIVTIIRIDPKESLFTKEALALGADEAVIIESGISELDDIAIARILTTYFEKNEADLILLGSDTNDRGPDTVGLSLGEKLGIVALGAVQKLQIGGSTLLVERLTDSGKEVVRSTIPAVVTCEDVLNEVRYPRVQDIMAAKEKQVTTITLEELYLKEEQLQPKIKVIEVLNRVKERSTQIFSGNVKEQVTELAQSLHKDKVL